MQILYHRRGAYHGVVAYYLWTGFILLSALVTGCYYAISYEFYMADCLLYGLSCYLCKRYGSRTNTMLSTTLWTEPYALYTPGRTAPPLPWFFYVVIISFPLLLIQFMTAFTFISIIKNMDNDRDNLQNLDEIYCLLICTVHVILLSRIMKVKGYQRGRQERRQSANNGWSYSPEEVFHLECKRHGSRIRGGGLNRKTIAWVPISTSKLTEKQIL